jgi:hypothetical protein
MHPIMGALHKRERQLITTGKIASATIRLRWLFFADQFGRLKAMYSPE